MGVLGLSPSWMSPILLLELVAVSSATVPSKLSLGDS
jgi:hypothetical protein